jgi:hypothetical protein
MVARTWLPAATEAMGFLVQQQPAREAAAAQLGALPYHATSFEHVSDALGQDYATYRESIEQTLVREMPLPDEVIGLVVSLDRVATPFEEVRPRGPGRPRKNAPRRSVQRAWRMSYRATVSLHNASGKTALRRDAERGCGAPDRGVARRRQRAAGTTPRLVCVPAL